MQNLKTAAASYAAADSILELRELLDDKKKELKDIQERLKETDNELKETRELLYYAKQYHDNLPYQKRYEKSKDPDRYLRMHEQQLILFDGANRKLRQMGSAPKSSDIELILSDCQNMQDQKYLLQQKYKSVEKEVKAMRQKIKNIEIYLQDSNISSIPKRNHPIL